MSTLRKSNTTTTCSSKNDHHFEYKNFTKKFACDGCKQLGSGPRYVCGICGDEFHQACLYPKETTKSHEFFQGATLQFFDEPQKQLCLKKKCKILHERCCDACGMDILGCNYHCGANRLDLHPMCSNLEKKLCINDTIFELHKGVVSRCLGCNHKRIRGGEKNVPGWSYISRNGDNNIHFHVHCLMEMVHASRDSSSSSLEGESSSVELMKIDLQMTSTKKDKGRGSSFLSMVKLFLKAIISVLVGDPTTLFASIFVELLLK